MSDLIPVVRYWPFSFDQRIIRWDYKAIDDSMPPLVALFYYDPNTNSMIYGDYKADGTWADNWFMQYRPGEGVVEWRDDYPGKSVVMSPPIYWGDMVRIGDSVANKPKFDTFKCSPWQVGSGEQIVVFEQLLPNWINSAGIAFNDVLVFSYQQRWGNGKWSGARYWNAAGLGPCAVQWKAQDPQGNWVETARMDGALTIYDNGAKVS